MATIKTKSGWWKFYFWVMLLLNLIGWIALASNISQFSLIDWVSSILGTLILVGLYSFVYTKNIITSKNWRIVFWVTVGAELISFTQYIYRVSWMPGFLTSSLDVSESAYMFVLIFSLPAYFAVYKLGTRNNI